MLFKKPIPKNFIIEIISLFFILLFVYASVSKLITFTDFQTQLGQSPLLGAFAIPISYAVIGIELVTSLLLAFIKTRKWGLYLSFFLMVMFTTYIVIILNFTSFTPCSCGGVLESLGWTEHLIFNIICILLAIGAIYFIHVKFSKQKLMGLLSLSALGIILVIGLFLSSEQEIKRNNAFQRKYSPHGLEEIGNFPLESNSFYIAGIANNLIYLGNYFAPLYLKAVDFQLKTSKEIKIEIENYQLPYKRVRIQVTPPYFFVGDGTVPILFKGNTTEWKAETFSKEDAYFYQFTLLDSTSLAISTTSTITNTNALGILKSINDSIKLNLNTQVLKQQQNGTFDTDGLLLYNHELQKIIYVYYYRNQYVITNKQLENKSQGKTIDTIKQAQIDVAYYSKKDEYNLGKSVLVNRTASVFGKHLFINSDRLGKYEDEDVLKSASIIDQYHITNNTYIQSFYFYHQPLKKLREFKVYKDLIIGLVDNQLWIYQIKPEYQYN